MKKHLIMNCGGATLLKDRENMLDKYDMITINCGGATITEEVNAIILGKGGKINCGGYTIIPSVNNPVSAPQLTVIDSDAYADKYVVCDNMVIRADGQDALEKLEGALIDNTLYIPKSLSGLKLANITANHIEEYPDNAEFIMGDVELESSTAGRWSMDTAYCVVGSIKALDAETLRQLKARNVSFQCRNLSVAGSAYDEFKEMFTVCKLQIIPEGYAFAAEDMSLASLYATYGEKVYLMRDITIPLGDYKHLKLFESIIVKGTAKVSADYIQEARNIIKADKIMVYEGQLLNINSVQFMNHDFFEAARKEGAVYNINVKGALILEDDVTAEDVKQICALSVKGAVLAPKATHQHLTSVSKGIKGVLLGSLSELKEMIKDFPPDALSGITGMVPPEILGVLGVKLPEGDSNIEVTQLNFGGFTLI